MYANCVRDRFAVGFRNLRPIDLTDFNLELLRYLAWYNLERPHFSLTQPVPGRKTPHLLSPVQFLHHNHQCNMYWPDTAICARTVLLLDWIYEVRPSLSTSCAFLRVCILFLGDEPRGAGATVDFQQ